MNAVIQKSQERRNTLARLLQDASPMMIEIWDEAHNLVDCNRRLLDTFGLESKEEYKNRYYEFSYERQPCGRTAREAFHAVMAEALTDGRAQCEWMHRFPDGRVLPVEIHAERFTYRGKRFVVLHMKDMREVYQAMSRERNALGELEYRGRMLAAVVKSAEVLLTAEKEDTLHALMEAMDIIGRCLNVDRVQIWSNEVVDDELHFSMSYEWLSEVGKQKAEVPIGLRFAYRDKPAWIEKFMRGESINTPISLLPPQDAALFSPYEMCSVVCLPLFLNNELMGFFRVDDCTTDRFFTTDEMGIIASAGLMFSSVFTRNAQHDLVFTDALTGVRNRRYITEIAEIELLECIQSETDFTLIMMDVDHFKYINDCHGHVVGDDVLRIITQRIGNALKSNTVIARYGGEEFIIMLPGVSRENAVKTAERLRRTITSSPFIIGNLAVDVTASFGVASLQHGGQNLTDIIEDADKHLYRAKALGRNRVEH